MEKLITSFSVENAKNFFKKNISTFKTDSHDFSYLLKESQGLNFSSLEKIGEASLDGSGDLLVFTSKFLGDLTERSSKKAQFELAKKLLKNDFKDGAIFIFYDENGNFRFSFIRRNYGDKVNKFSNWKRFTYYVTPNATNNTFTDRIGNCSFTSLDEIQDAFSVEKLNKEFYQNIAKAFYSLIGGKIKINTKEEDFKLSLKLPSVSDSDKSVHQKFAVRLVGRTIFCWFLKNKVSDNGLPLLPEGWLSSKVVTEVNNNQHSYYHGILEKLFFEVLNKRIENRPANLPDGHKNIPYLNGGLFESIHDDFYEADKTSGTSKFLNTLVIPNKWFIDFFEVLERYNFTIDENTVNDSEVSIDPEMLGTIFENLLAEIDPDTEKSARKSTGSFYTPRQIVDYMVEQSLIQYIKSEVPVASADSLEVLFNDEEELQLSQKEIKLILEAISRVKILDPACGSGAFPMGALHKIVKILQKLDKEGEWWKKNQLEKAKDLDSKFYNQLKEKLDASNSDYARKLGVIQHSIYGVDIQPIAAEISKLRSFLSLIIDENIDDKAPNRGIEPLPNLEFKFVTANTLVGLDESISKNKGSQSTGTLDFGETEDLQQELKNLRNTYLQANPLEKEKLKKEFLEIQTKIFKQETKGSTPSKRAIQLSSWKPFSNESSSWFDSEWMFGVPQFDIVIGNPPYSVFQGKAKDSLKDIMSTEIFKLAKGGKINAYELFLCKAILLLKDGGINCQIFQNSFLGDNSASNLRKYYLEDQKIVFIDSFPERDNPKKRVFESVKMSVCILLNENKKVPNYNFSINFWEDRYKSIGKKIIYNNNEVVAFSPGQYIIYNLDPKEKAIFEKYYIDNSNKFDDFYECLEGELNMTFHKEYLTNDKKNPLVVKGAQVQRYFITDNPSQGEISFVDEKKYLRDYVKSKKSKHHEQDRIAMQGITGANDVNRIVSTFVRKGIYLANSCNYIIKNSEDIRYDLYFLLGLFNSNFTNWIFRRSSTNSNVNCYEVNNLRLPNFNKIAFQKIAEFVKLNLNTIDKSLEKEIDVIVYKLYKLNFDEIKLIDSSFGMSESDYNNIKF